jgi:hypothetical protein
MTELINAIITTMQDKQPTEDQVNAILAQVCHVYCYTEKYALTILYQRKAKKVAQRVRASNLKAANPTNSGPAQ